MSQELERYDDVQPVGEWGVLDTETGVILDRGVLLGQTIKVKEDDGSVRLERDWFPDRPSNL